VSSILAVTAPFFALVLCGWLAARQHVLPESAIPGLNAFVLYFALPCMLFRFGAGTPVLQVLNPTILAVYLLCAALMVGFTIAVTLGPEVQLKDAAFGALVAAFPNTGFMGVPLLVALLGPAAAGPAICTITADLVITTTACLALAEAQGATGQGLWKAPGASCWAWPRTRCPGPSRSARLLGHGLEAGARPTPSCACWPMPPARWRCSPSARCCGAPGSMPTPHAGRPLPAGGADQAAAAPACCC
jgi:hypothetical protein